MVNRAKEFIEQHWRENVTLDQVAAHVYSSPFHFQRIFKRETGETPKEYLTRIRLEGAVQQIRVDLEKSVYDVGFECGFSSQAVFARAFRQRFGVSATEFRKLTIHDIASLSVWDPSIQRLFESQMQALPDDEERAAFIESVTLTRIEPIHVAYLRTTMVSDAHLGGEFRRLADLAAAHDLPANPAQCFGVMYDFPLHTPLEKCRYKACVGIAGAQGTAATAGGSGVHGKSSQLFSMTIAGGKYAVFPVEGGIEMTIRRVILFFNDWIKGSQYQRGRAQLIERFPSLPDAKGYASTKKELYIPIKPI